MFKNKTVIENESNDFNSSDSNSNSEEENLEDIPVEDEGELIHIDILKNGFNWCKYCTTVDVVEERLITVSKDYIPVSGGITEKYIVNRCNFLKLELTIENKEKIKDILESHQRVLRNTVKQWIQWFWIEMCIPLGIHYNNGRNMVSTFAEFQTAIRQLKTREDAKKIAICLYVCFDFCNSFRKKISRNLMKQHGFKLDNRKVETMTNSNNKKLRKRKDCFEKLVSQILTDQRKNLNNMSIITCGYTFTNQRTNLNEYNEAKFRTRKKFYDWMILGENVSNIIFTICLNFISNLIFFFFLQ